MTLLNAHVTTVLLAVFLTTVSYTLVSSYSINAHAPQHPTSALTSKVVFQSPSVMENIYKEFIVSSKPLYLRKYSSGMKTRKTKKDSKIYYIPIPPLPYRFIPGVGYDYQPMKINSIMKEAPTALLGANKAGASGSISNSYANFKTQLLPQKPQQSHNILKHLILTSENTTTQLKEVSGSNSSKTKTDTDAPGESQILHLQRGDYLLNGLPIRLQVAHALPKHQLTAQNLKSNFYFNKNIIYEHYTLCVLIYLLIP